MTKKCALEKKVLTGWIPVAIRYYRFPVNIMRDLNRGEVVVYEGSYFRRSDWAERKALCAAIPFTLGAHNANGNLENKYEKTT